MADKPQSEAYTPTGTPVTDKTEPELESEIDKGLAAVGLRNTDMATAYRTANAAFDRLTYAATVPEGPRGKAVMLSYKLRISSPDKKKARMKKVHEGRIASEQEVVGMYKDAFKETTKEYETGISKRDVAIDTRSKLETLLGKLQTRKDAITQFYNHKRKGESDEEIVAALSGRYEASYLEQFTGKTKAELRGMYRTTEENIHQQTENNISNDRFVKSTHLQIQVCEQVRQSIRNRIDSLEVKIAKLKDVIDLDMPSVKLRPIMIRDLRVTEEVDTKGMDYQKVASAFLEGQIKQLEVLNSLPQEGQTADGANPLDALKTVTSSSRTKLDAFSQSLDEDVRKIIDGINDGPLM
jgi:BMFP domain-containing protein YqiC